MTSKEMSPNRLYVDTNAEMLSLGFRSCPGVAQSLAEPWSRSSSCRALMELPPRRKV